MRTVQRGNRKPEFWEGYWKCAGTKGCGSIVEFGQGDVRHANQEAGRGAIGRYVYYPAGGDQFDPDPACIKGPCEVCRKDSRFLKHTGVVTTDDDDVREIRSKRGGSLGYVGPYGDGNSEPYS